MGFLTIDLGTTNIKVATFDDELNELAVENRGVKYLRHGKRVEFDAETYFSFVKDAISECCRRSFSSSPYPLRQIVLTGQAESLVILGGDMQPLRPAISWMDMRSEMECIQLEGEFSPDTGYHITGQPAIIPTWPVTKILWLKKNESQIYEKIEHFLLLKDFIQYRLSGKLAGEYSIYNFSYFFNITQKKYWQEILDFCGIPLSHLPDLVEPCTLLGKISSETASDIDINPDAVVNVGTLDHFASMVGTGNIHKGIISESTGTVMSIAALLNQPLFCREHIPCHYGPFKDSYVLLPVVESGGVCLEWLRENFMKDLTFDQINDELSKRELPNRLVFLPYLTGVNAPDFNASAKGVFYGIRLENDRFDLAAAVMEGLAHLLKKNIDQMEAIGVPIRYIISTGGGAKSDVWSSIKAGVTNREVRIPCNTEAACMGAAIIGAVTEGLFGSYEEAIIHCISMKKTFQPVKQNEYSQKHRMFNLLYKQLQPVYKESSGDMTSPQI